MEWNPIQKFVIKEKFNNPKVVRHTQNIKLEEKQENNDFEDKLNYDIQNFLATNLFKMNLLILFLIHHTRVF